MIILKEKWKESTKDTKEIIVLFTLVLFTLFIVYPLGIKATTGKFPVLFHIPILDIKTTEAESFNYNNIKSEITSSNTLLDNGKIQNQITYNGESYIQTYGIGVTPTTVTTEIMVEWILRKGNELISIMQVVARPFAIIIFIFSAGLALIGAITKGDMMIRGLMGMGLSSVIYALVLCAPAIINILPNFFSS